jgi:hypothetical protein
MSGEDKVVGFGLLVWLICVIAGGVGWILNIVAICHSSFSPFTPMLAMRLIGIFVVPVGSVLGYIS